MTGSYYYFHLRVSSSSQQQHGRLGSSSRLHLLLVLMIALVSTVGAFPLLAQRRLGFSRSSKELRRSVSCSVARLHPVFDFPGRFLTRRYPVESSDATAATLVGQREKVTVVSKQFSTLLENTKEVAKSSSRSMVSGLKLIGNHVRENWWYSPMILALVPVASIIFLQRLPSMPPFWRVGKLDQVFSSPYASLIICSFLLSNLSYILSGAYLMLKLSSTLTLKQVKANCKKQRFRLFTTRYTWLGAWIIAAGFISTIFHGVQALGPYSLAEGMCYLDHGVALSAFCYFLYVCGPPSLTVCTWGIAGLIALALPVPSGAYPYSHSVWHFLSATAATIWATQGFQHRRSMKRILSASLTDDDSQLTPSQENSARGQQMPTTLS